MYIRPRIRAAKKMPETEPPVDHAAVEQMMDRFGTKVVERKPDPYRPIENFEFYSSTCLIVAGERYEEAKKMYKTAVEYVRVCRAQNIDILYAVTLLQKSMENMDNLRVEKEEERLEKMRELEVVNQLLELPASDSSLLLPLPTVDMSHVYVTTKVQKKSNRVKVKLTTPLIDLSENYYQKLKRPPIADKIRVYSKLGYPSWYLEGMLVSYGKQLQRKPEIERLIEIVFDKYDAKKPSKSKPKSMIQKLNRPLLSAFSKTVEDVPQEPPKNGISLS